jgi:hypothetical protein
MNYQIAVIRLSDTEWDWIMSGPISRWPTFRIPGSHSTEKSVYPTAREAFDAAEIALNKLLNESARPNS